MQVEVIIQKGDNRYEAVINPEKDYNLDFGLFGEGSTVEETIEDFLVSQDEMRELYEEEKKEFPHLEFKYIYDLSSFLAYYSKILSFAALERLTQVNQSQLSQYVNGYRKPSAKTAKKIEEKLHKLATELSQVQFV